MNIAKTNIKRITDFLQKIDLSLQVFFYHVFTSRAIKDFFKKYEDNY